MTPYSARRSGSLALPRFAASGALVVVLGILALWTILWAFGVVGGRPAEPSTAGLVAVPTLSQRVPAYTRILRDHLWDPRNQRLSVVYLPPGSVTPEMIVRVSDVLGRVLSHEKAPGYVFTEDDFLPRGTREGLVAGIPAGKRAVRISGERVEGLHGLNRGDRFDLLATLPIDGAGGGASGSGIGGVYGPEIAIEARLSNWQKQATVRVMVQNAIIVEPLGVRGVPSSQATLTEGSVTRMRPVQEAVIAVNPEEVARLTEALAVEARITAVPRSGRPDDPVDSPTPDLRPVGPFSGPEVARPVGGGAAGRADGQYRVVETIKGQKRELTAVPR